MSNVNLLFVPLLLQNLNLDPKTEVSVGLGDSDLVEAGPSRVWHKFPDGKKCAPARISFNWPLSEFAAEHHILRFDIPYEEFVTEKVTTEIANHIKKHILKYYRPALDQEAAIWPGEPFRYKPTNIIITSKDPDLFLQYTDASGSGERLICTLYVSMYGNYEEEQNKIEQEKIKARRSFEVELSSRTNHTTGVDSVGSFKQYEFTDYKTGKSIVFKDLSCADLGTEFSIFNRKFKITIEPLEN